ncbi:MAG: D-3-phosphoglycerate dehydrogenase [Actinobacteria bacterium 69-20]|nr:phosphoglycerate dehydrogenase [Actinomycetota bacterium]OJV24839.1 MAG: D-3-phosphoglycerate dehydrogenase [Actinobacteria bacterium 69-20]
MRALLLENIHPDAVTVLTEAGHEVRTMDHALQAADLASELSDVELLGIRSGTTVTAEILDSAPNLKAIGAFCIGTNQIDLIAAAERGIAVFNAPYSNTRSVVEIALAEIIALTRRLTVQNHAMHEGRWAKSASGAHEVRGRSLGIVGYGNIGSQLSVLAESLGMTVHFYDTAEKLALGTAKKCQTLDELLGQCDVVTLHVDGRPGNHGFFGDREFAQMKPGAIFLNLSRGFVVDHTALKKHIESKHLAGAAIDVFPKEPKKNGDPFLSELRGLDNVILTPHVGGSTEEAQQHIGNFVAGKLRDYVGLGRTSLSVNMPRLGLGKTKDHTRIVHIHRNVPGVLATINGLLAEHGVNIESQQLATAGDLGYVATDIIGAPAPEIVDKLASMPETIRLSVLG